MSAETFVNALFLITAVVAAGILITAVLPIVWNMAGTFSTASHESDTRMRTDFKIVAYFAKPDPDNHGEIYLKNVGSYRIPINEIKSSDVFFGEKTKFTRLKFVDTPSNPEEWTCIFTESYDINGNTIWDTGETIQILAYPKEKFNPNDEAYFQFILPNGVLR